jgi:hypothetical protein
MPRLRRARHHAFGSGVAPCPEASPRRAGSLAPGVGTTFLHASQRATQPAALRRALDVSPPRFAGHTHRRIDLARPAVEPVRAGTVSAVGEHRPRARRVRRLRRGVSRGRGGGKFDARGDLELGERVRDVQALVAKSA